MLSALIIITQIGHAITTVNDTINITAPTILPSVTPVVTQSVDTTITESATETPLPCVAPCSCYMENDNLTVRCNISLLSEGWRLPDNYTSLDLSFNGLQRVPTVFFKKQNLKHLLILSLRGNNLTVIEEDAFSGLENLEILDISSTNLKEWKGNVQRTLPSLKLLKVMGNYPWMPGDNVLSLKGLHEIDGVGWSEFCNDCRLLNRKYHTQIQIFDGIGKSRDQKPVTNSSFQPTQIITIISNDTVSGPMPGPGNGGVVHTDSLPIDPRTEKAHRVFGKWGFLAQCRHPATTQMHEAIKCQVANFFTNKEVLKQPTRLLYIAYVLGSLGIILNFSIIFIYVYSSNIRKINSMLLISNMAFCDILIGIYAIIIAKNNIFSKLLQRLNPEEEIRLGICGVASVLFTVGETVSVCTALLLTIDKFLSIVYCMDPNLKLSRRLSLLVLLLCWVGAIIYAFSPQFSKTKYSPTLMCTFPHEDIKGLTITLSLLALLYFAIIPLYAKIFLFVRRSSVRMGVRRDAALAKKIAVLILTNFVFFAVPIILTIIFSFVFSIHKLIVVDNTNAIRVRFIICFLVPNICFCINSCLNPFLCAFRQRQFRREFKKCMRKVILSRFCKAFSTFRTDSSVRNTQPTRVEMYKLSNIDSQVQAL